MFRRTKEEEAESVRNLSRFALLGFVILLTITFQVHAGVWTTLDYPGASSTQIVGIDGNNIVGSYKLGSQTHGFLYDGVTWTTLDMPGASNTYAQDIDGDKITGWYYGTRPYGFIYDGTSWTSFSVPEDNLTLADGIDGDNIVGHYHASGKLHGFLYDGASWTTLDAPWATEGTFPTGISGNNIVGYSSNHGFIFDGTTWTTLDMPGAWSTNILDIDGSNIVGYYNGYAGTGFLYDGVTWTTITMPGASLTRLAGISGNNIVGYYSSSYGPDEEIWHGFLYTIPEPCSIALFATGLSVLMRNNANLTERIVL